MKKISKYLLYLFIILVLVPLTFLFTLPKFFLLNELLERSGIFLLNGKVEEGFTYLRVKDMRLFAGSREVARFREGYLRLSPIGIEAGARCEGKGSLSLSRSLFGTLTLELKGLSCLEGVDLASGKVRLKEGAEGRLSVKGVKIENLSLDEVILKFNGSKVDVVVKTAGSEFRGKLKVDWKPNLLDSRVSGTLKSRIMSLSVGGTLGGLHVKGP